MVTSAEAKTKVDKLITNMDRLNTIVNGTAIQTVATDSGTVPTIAKFFADNQALLDSLAGGLIGSKAPGSTDIEFQHACDLDAAVQRFRVTTQSSGSTRVLQGWAENEIGRAAYSLHLSTGADDGVINKFQVLGPNAQTSYRWLKTPNTSIGHQSLSVERTKTGVVRFWSSANYAISVSASKAVRYSISDDPGDTEGLVIGNMETYTLFGDSASWAEASNGSTNPTISPDGRFLVAKRYLTGNTVRFRVWLLKDLIAGGPGNYSTSYKYQFDVGSFYDSTNYPIQGIACDGMFIYCIAGYADSTGTYAKKRLGKFSLDGTYKEINDEFNVGLAEALTDGAGTHYEPEGLFITRHGGRNVLGVIISSGDSGARVNRIWYLDADRVVQGRSVGNRPAFMSSGEWDYGVPDTENMVFVGYNAQTDAKTTRATLGTDGGWDPTFLKPHYDSGWFNVSADNNYSRTHNLGTTELLVVIHFKDGSNRIFQLPTGFASSTSHETGCSIYLKDNNTIEVATGNDGVFAHDNLTLSSTVVVETTGQYRIRLFRIG